MNKMCARYLALAMLGAALASCSLSSGTSAGQKAIRSVAVRVGGPSSSGARSIISDTNVSAVNVAVFDGSTYGLVGYGKLSKQAEYWGGAISLSSLPATAVFEATAIGSSGTEIYYGSASSTTLSGDGGDVVTVGMIEGSGIWTFAPQSLSQTGGYPCVASSADGQQLATVESTGHNIFTSSYLNGLWENMTQGTSASGLSWQDLVSSMDGSHLAAIESTNDDIWTSTDYGVTWTDQTTSGSSKNSAAHGLSWEKLASSADGTRLAAVVGSGDVWTSADSGLTWVDRTASGPKSWISVASSSSGARLAAVVNGGDVWTSSDYGATWTDRTPSGAAHSLYWTNIVSSADGSHLAAQEFSNKDIWTSSDYGATWTDRTSSGAAHGLLWFSFASSADGSRLAASDMTNIWTSCDFGQTWTNQASSLGTGNGIMWSLALSADGRSLIAGPANGKIYIGTVN
jgi:hypothetical protein